MEGLYDILRGGEKIGKAQVTKEGLYYRFRCCCDLTGEVIYRLTVTCGDQTENLGIPIPEGDAFYLTKRLPVSRFTQGKAEFRAVPRTPERTEAWVPIVPDTPFDYISRLEDGILERRDDTLGILIPPEEPAPAPQDSDQSP